ncbi:MAG: transketolase [Clostridiales bacterium]|jgi:transketolase|nr:transketolase [Clostridiales bacterium]
MNDLAVNTLRFLSVDAVQKANSGHPGLPMGAAPAAYALWKNVLKHNPKNPAWHDRDRFILSAGHGSALLYSLLHVFGYGVSLEDLKNFRQWGSLTPGHPEYRHTPGVEITTGPLGQGIANAVGFAWAESYLAARFNKPGLPLVDHFTYALCGDGCLMEGVSAEAASLAGTLGLGRLILLYDSNNITIEGSTDIAFTEDVRGRFAAYGWHTQKIDDGNDTAAITRALEAAKKITDKPSLIEIKTVIGYGSPNKQGKASSHGAPLGGDEVALTRQNLEWGYTETFRVPEEVREEISNWQPKAQAAEDAWKAIAEEYAQNYPGDWKAWECWHNPQPDIDFENLTDFWEYEGDIATRASSEILLNKVCKLVPNLFGGSADLAPSNLSVMKGLGDYAKGNPAGANLHFGVREHAMTAIANGLSAHGGLRPYAAGFFVFSDYMKPALRLSAMMKLPVVYIMTHDSIGVGEDGPTHEPIEQLAMLRSIPGFTVIRPCDTRETAAAWALAITRTDSPTALILSRQNLPLLPESGKGALKGAYILRESINPKTGLPDILLMASGSEVDLICKARDILRKEHGVHARVVSFPSFEIFNEQSGEYKQSVLPDSVRARLAVEAASDFGWHRYVGLDGDIIAINGFGASAPAGTLFKEFGFTVENVAERALKLYRR